MLQMEILESHHRFTELETLEMGPGHLHFQNGTSCNYSLRNTAVNQMLMCVAESIGDFVKMKTVLWQV